ncbi:MAG TPA: DUF2231 domain-containing protein [Tepidisphaeraceae bacterium]|jgi:uncharacterized membrane protein|nr:DUF2231 domain-containing protein [Tepidisphaeraceae bacterium]
MREFIIPNWHVILIHYPLALVTVGTLIEIFSFLWRRSGFRAAGRWMILLGALSAIPAATSGIYAARDVLGGTDDLSWRELKEQSAFNAPDQKVTDDRWDELRDHVIMNSAATGALALVVLFWVGCSDRWRARLHLLFVAWLLVTVGFLTSGAWHGGEMIYRHGISVDTNTPSMEAQKESDKAEKKDLDMRAQEYVPPIQLHVTMAGWTVALALVSLALAIRAISATRLPADWEIKSPGDLDFANALNERTGEIGAPPTQREITTSDLPTDDSPVFTVPAARFWLVTTLVALATAAAGVWTMGMWNMKDLMEELRNENHTRALAHGVVGVTIVVLTIILAILARWAKQNKVMLALFSLLMILAIAAQVWLGVLMVFDTSGGPLTRFS